MDGLAWIIGFTCLWEKGFLSHNLMEGLTAFYFNIGKSRFSSSRVG